MNSPDSEDALRLRLRELGRIEEAAAPGFARVLRGGSGILPATAGASLPGRGVHLVWALGTIAVLSVGSICWQTFRRPAEPTTVDVVVASEEDWRMPTDGLLADAEDSAAAPEIERLSREITALLRP
jgi:hypothetical protein